MSALRSLLAILLLTGCATGAAPRRSPEAHGCFRRHVLEAIALNEARRPVYAARSGGTSTAISDRLIAYERASLAFAAYFDHGARPYQEAGIPLFCAEFVSMEDLPEVDRAPRSEAPRPLDGEQLRRELALRLREGGFSGLERGVALELRALGSEPVAHCMVRHLLESIRRAAQLAPRHRREAQAANLPDPSPLSRRFIQTHLLVLEAAAALDSDAVEAQARGAPILCADLPHIPPPERPAV